MTNTTDSFIAGLRARLLDRRAEIVAGLDAELVVIDATLAALGADGAPASEPKPRKSRRRRTARAETSAPQSDQKEAFDGDAAIDMATLDEGSWLIGDTTTGVGIRDDNGNLVDNQPLSEEVVDGEDPEPEVRPFDQDERGPRPVAPDPGEPMT